MGDESSNDTSIVAITSDEDDGMYSLIFLFTSKRPICFS